MVATLFKSGSSFTLGDRRTYDSRGVVRSGAASGEPNARYCANLGHLADDESGLTYMRARHYEASSGRFPSMDGANWFTYVSNYPTSTSDFSGRDVVADGMLLATISSFLIQYLRGEKSPARGARFFMACLGQLAINAVAQKLEPYIRQALRTIEALLRLDRMNNPSVFGERAGRFATRWTIAAFYAGYAISLVMIAVQLEAWANGDYED